VKFPYPVAPIVRAHHEKWDGTGYPSGMKGEEIPISARILSLVDAFDAQISARHHRPALSLDEALASIMAESGSAYDPHLVMLLKKHHTQWERLVATAPDGGFIGSIASAQKELQVVLNLTQKLGASLELGEIFSALDSSVRALIPFDTLVVRMEREGKLTTEYVAGDHIPLWSPLHIPMGSGISGAVAANQKPMVNGDAALDLCGSPCESANAPRFVLAVPLEAKGHRGVLTLYRAGDLAFCNEDARVLAAVAPKLASALSNGLKFRATETQAATDGLTGLPNASALFARLESGKPVAVLVCDLDGFKNVNDRFGHMTGNRVLEALADGFRKSCRGEDFVARLGGDEFVLLMAQLSPEEIGARIQQFRDMVHAIGRQVCGESILDASFGAAFYPKDGTTPEELIAFADRQMYRHKTEQKAGVIRIQQFKAGA
jgi:diguanylate cyclase (GGDEF)-like protein